MKTLARFMVPNTMIASTIIFLMFGGFLDPFLIDRTNMIYLIVAVSGFALVYTFHIFYSVYRIGRTIDSLAATRFRKIEYFDNAIQEKIGWIDSLSTLVVSLGLLGTVVGISMAFYGVDPESIGDTEAVKQVIGTLMGGLATAFNTTLMGTFFMIWIKINRQVIIWTVMQIRSRVITPGNILNG